MVVNNPIQELDNEGTQSNHDPTHENQEHYEPNHIGNEDEEYTYDSALVNQNEELKEEDDGMGNRRVWDDRLNGWVVKSKS